jgi:hypothetical protein
MADVAYSETGMDCLALWVSLGHLLIAEKLVDAGAKITSKKWYLTFETDVLISQYEMILAF